ncbi:hypothetical protein NDU88_004443 [Pleurodeles waltl]|uniref:Uncharacterized protein n=1 Tax=Pleurodeles waltl TaxID=8319 RepID=A0AAV7SIS9_PLEWA|nr:hypothetical protein NDU88_004443 [Pleurodeles waltl]
MTENNTLIMGQARAKPLSKRGKGGVRLRLRVGFIEKTEPGAQQANREETGSRRRALNWSAAGKIQPRAEVSTNAYSTREGCKLPTRAEETQMVTETDKRSARRKKRMRLTSRLLAL